jgi:carboxyl-terminal processing protease
MKLDTLEGDNFSHVKDTKDTTRPVFKTFGGRNVFGGGGISPDFFVRLDTLTKYSVQLRRLNLIYEYTEKYMVSNRKNIEGKYKSYRDFASAFKVTDDMLRDLIDLGKSRNVVFDQSGYDIDKKFIETSIRAQIARDIWGNEGFYAVFMMSDEQVLRGLSLIDEAAKLLR